MSRSLFRLLSSVFSASPWCNPHPSSFILHPSSFPRRRAYTLVELLISTVLALIVMFGVVSVFAMIGQGVADSRSTLEMSEQLRAVASMLKDDLGGVTVVMSPPRSPEDGEGYFEYTEGPIGPILPFRPSAGAAVEFALNTSVTLPNGSNPPDTTEGDIDDMLIFTTRSHTEPFVGRYAGGFVESSDAEIAYFVRGRTLYRRVLLIAPTLPVAAQPAAGFYLNNDISVRIDKSTGTPVFAANTLADLTKPENRFAHQPLHWTSGGYAPGYPFHPHFFADKRSSPWTFRASQWATWSVPPFVGPVLPTLRECSYWYGSPLDVNNSWIAGGSLPLLWNNAWTPNSGTKPLPGLAQNGLFDAWSAPHPWTNVDPVSGTLNLPPAGGSSATPYMGTRLAEDVVLNNVIGFDVKAWDPGAPVLLLVATGQILMPGDPGYFEGLRHIYVVNDSMYSVVSRGAYVDLNYGCLLGPGSVFPPRGCAGLVASGSVFAGPGVTGPPITWGSYTFLGADPATTVGVPPTVLRPAVYDTWSMHYEQELGGGIATNGFDDNSDGVVDDPGERQYPPPYPVPLRGIQIKIRCFEPSSRQIREVTVIQEFVTK